MKTLIVMNGIVRATAFICITITAICFQKISVLWWYILPALMSIDYKKEGGNENAE